MPNRIVPIVLALILATMLIGAQFGFTWAGGDGYVPPVQVTVVAANDTDVRVEHAGSMRFLGTPDHPKRGEIIHIGDGYVDLDFGGTGTIVSLDANTDLEIVSLKRERIEVRLLRGRMAVAPHPDMKKFTVHAGPAEFTVFGTGWLSVFHDLTKGTVSVAPIGTSVTALLEGTDSFVATSPFNYVYWWTPPGTEDISFNPATGATAPFYRRFLEAAGLD